MYPEPDPILTHLLNTPAGSANGAAHQFCALLTAVVRPKVLELGTRRWNDTIPTHHKHFAPESDYVMCDILEGLDVDVVADAHDLAPFEDASFDAYIAISTYEHLQRPWIAAKAARRILRPGGLLLVVTHQTFPIHGYPYDFFRFTDTALAGIFADAGFDIIERGYEYPSVITPPPGITIWNPLAPSFLNVGVTARAI